MKLIWRVASIYLRFLAKVYIKCDLSVNAVKCLDKAISLTPQEKKLYLLLADAFQISGRLDSMLTTLESATKFFPDEKNFFWVLGTRLLYLGRHSEAVDYLKHYSDNLPKDKYEIANIYAILGSCYLALLQWDKAEEYLKKSKELVPWDLDAFVSLVELYACTGRSSLILEFIDDYIDKYPSLYPLYLWKAHHLQYSLRQPQKSLESYQQGLQRIGSREAREFCDGYLYTKNLFDRLLNEYINALIVCGRSNEVLSEIQKYEMIKIGSPIESKKRLVDFHIEIKNFSEARMIVNDMPSRIVHTSEILASLAKIELNSGEIEKSLNIIKSALLVDSMSDEAFDVLGEIQMKAGKWRDAVENYETLIKRHPLAADLQASLGLCYFEMRQYEKALECYETCVRYDELDADAWIDLGSIYMKLGHNESALSAYKNGLKYDWLSTEKRQLALQALGQFKAG